VQLEEQLGGIGAAALGVAVAAQGRRRAIHCSSIGRSGCDWLRRRLCALALGATSFGHCLVRTPAVPRLSESDPELHAFSALQGTLARDVHIRVVFRIE
jgi:hypothetical protein